MRTTKAEPEISKEQISKEQRGEDEQITDLIAIAMKMRPLVKKLGEARTQWESALQELNLKKLRKAHGLSLEACARMCGDTSFKTWQRWEVGENTPPFERILPFFEKLRDRSRAQGSGLNGESTDLRFHKRNGK